MSAQPAVKLNSSASYDEVPYESFSHPATHPQHLRTVATLFGLNPPDFKTAKVLELGCAAGGNLFPLALAYPDASFLGVDFSQEQISRADKEKEALNVKNLDFMRQDIMSFAPKNAGDKFDYIIVHGVFSWVPDTVRDKILSICNEYLSPNGVALISYNTLPGWNAVRSVRDMMMFHSNRFTQPADKIRQSRILLDFLAENVQQDQTAYRAIIEDERNMLKNKHDTYLYHEHLENVNAQFYFHDFERMAREHGLNYVGDSNVASMFVGNMPPKALEALKAIDDVVSQEQYMDFITNRRFRSSILCKNNLVPNRKLRNEQVMNYFMTANPLMTASGTDPKKEIVYQINKGNVTMRDETTNTLMLELLACGQKPILATELVERAAKKLGLKDSTPVKNNLIQYGLQFFLHGYVLLFSDSPHIVREISKNPVAYPLARYQASLPNNFCVTSALGATVTTDAFVNLLISSLDGTKSIPEVLTVIIDSIKKGVLRMERNNTPIKDEAEIKENATQLLAATMQKLVQHGLLIG